MYFKRADYKTLPGTTMDRTPMHCNAQKAGQARKFTAPLLKITGDNPKRRALIQALIMAIAGTLFSLAGHKPWMGMILYGLSAFVVMAGFLMPALFRKMEQFGQWFGRMAGIGMTWLLLLPFFYLCFAPARLILKMIGKDPMQRKLDPQQASYWADYRPPGHPQPYSKQY